MTNLNTVMGMNKFCGPAVLAVLTGKTTDECARVISSVNGAYKVEGVLLSHLMKAADKLGFDNQAVLGGNTLYSTLVRLAKSDGMYIVTVPNHFVAIEVKEGKAYFCDNHTKEPIPAGSSARLLQQVLNVNKVFKRPDTVIEKPKPVVEIVKPVEPSNTVLVAPERTTPERDEIMVYAVYDGSKQLVATFRYQTQMMAFRDANLSHGYYSRLIPDNRKKWEKLNV